MLLSPGVRLLSSSSNAQASARSSRAAHGERDLLESLDVAVLVVSYRLSCELPLSEKATASPE